MNLVVAEGPVLDTIIELTWPVWNEGLTPAAYRQWNLAQMRTPWGRERLRRVALTSAGGTLLSSAKRYRFDVRAGGRDGWLCGIGAVFTPPDQRGHGYAGELIERVVAEARSEGALAAALFSEIGARFYERLGFRHVPLDEVTVTVRPFAGAPAMLVRAGDDRDLGSIVAMHDVRRANVPFALRRSGSQVAFALARRRLLAGLGPPGLRQVEFFVAEEGASAVAYVILSQNANGWTLEEAGDRDPAGARLGAMLQVLLAREPSRQPPLIRAWWPRSFAVPPQLELTDVGPAHDLFMLRPLAGIDMPTGADDVFYWRSDYF